MTTEAPHEKHNRIGHEIIDLIYAEYPHGAGAESRLLVLESLCFAFISGMTKDHKVQLKVLDLLFSGIRARLLETDR